MRIRRDWFNTLAIFLFESIILFALTAGISGLADGREYSWLLRGQWIGTVALILIVFVILSSLYSRLELSKKLSIYSSAGFISEILVVILILCAAIKLRLNHLAAYSVEPYGEYKSFYDIAELIYTGQLDFNSYYRNFIAMFPFHYGYPHLLSILFSFTGIKLTAAVFLNLAMQIGALILVWLIARKLGGSLAGLISLSAFSFLPSNVTYSNFLAEEFEFVFLLLLGIFFLVIQNQHDRKSGKAPFLEAVLLSASGIIFGIATWVQPFVPVILAAILLYMRNGTSWMPEKPKNEISLGLRMTEKGWQRILILMVFYLATFLIGQKGITYAVNKQISDISSSLGYSFMTGMNAGSDGKWNREDSDYLYGVLNETGSAVEAQLSCRALGFERMGYSGKNTGNLMLKKIADVAGTDDFAVSLITMRLQEKDALTDITAGTMDRVFFNSNFYYLVILFFAGAAALIHYFRKPGFSLFFILLCDGAFLMFLFLENQPRNHYFLLPIFSIMSGMAFSGLYQLTDQYIMNQKKEEARAKQRDVRRAERIADIEAFEHEIEQLRAEALHAQFDMETAIKEGHIRIIASEAVSGQSVQPQNNGPDRKIEEASNITLVELEKLAEKDTAADRKNIDASNESDSDADLNDRKEE